MNRLCTLIWLFSSYVMYGQPPDVLKINSVHDFILSGKGDAQEWKKAEWTELPHRAGLNMYTTRVKLLYSETGVYGLFYCEDRRITSTLREDFSDLYNEDVVEVFFWTDERMPLYFEYELSPHNFELPILVPNSHGDFFGWRPWHYEGNRMTRHSTDITEKSWTAEFFIPYTLLKPLQQVPPTKGTRWRGNFYRIDYDEGSSEWSWQLTQSNFHDFEKFGTLLFN